MAWRKNDEQKNCWTDYFIDRQFDGLTNLMDSQFDGHTIGMDRRFDGQTI